MLLFPYLFTLILFTNINRESGKCNETTKPTSAPEDVCVYFCPSKVGFPINEKLYRDNAPHSLHGFWFKIIKDSLKERYTFTEFLNLNQKFKVIFYDVTSLNNTVGCGQYREYIKHGPKSGYNYQEWKTKVDNCPIPEYPHQCSFNGTHNIVLTLSTANLNLIGCKEDYPFITYCRF